MKKSEKIQRNAVQVLLLSIVTFSASVAVGVWSVSAWLSHPAWGLVVATIALAVLAFAVAFLLDAVRLLQLADYEDRLEMERAIRPRL